MYIKYDDRQEKMNAKCYKPSASFARKTPSATSNDHNPSKENAKCYMQVHHPSKENTETYMQVRHPSKENAKSYKNRVPPSTSQETSPKHYDVKYDGPPRKSGTSSATVQSYSEYELGMEVVIGRGPTPVKIFMRLWLQKFVPGVVPQPLVRVMTMV